jgi:Integrase core domain.
VLTDNGKAFTDRFCATGEREPTGRHPVDCLCAEHAIDHRLIKPAHPQTNGMVERFPVQALMRWHQEQPDLFLSDPGNLPGPDN